MEVRKKTLCGRCEGEMRRSIEERGAVTLAVYKCTECTRAWQVVIAVEGDPHRQAPLMGRIHDFEQGGE